MTSQQKNEALLKVYAAWNAGFITTDECDKQCKEVHKQFYLANYGEYKAA